MPFPFLNFRSELDPTTRKELDELTANLTEWLSKEHHSDGTHAAITADSVEVNGDLTVHGFTGFEDLSGNTILANQVTAAIVDVQGQLFLPGGTMAAYNGDGSAGSQLVFEIVPSLRVVQIGNSTTGSTLNAYADIATLSSGGVTGSLNINSGKFSVDGATGNVGTAGVLTASQSSGSLVRHSFLNTNAGHIQTDLNIGKGGGADVYVGVNYLGGTNAFIDNRSGGDLLFKDGGTTHVTFTSTGVTIEGTLRAKGAIQFDSLTSGYLNTDGSGNVSATAGVPLVQNGVNFGPLPVASITVVNGQITNIS